MNGGALSDLKVVEFGEFVSGPYCGKLLADLGAEVIKVEKPGLGDKARSWGPFPGDIPHLEKSGLFLFLNMNKLSVTLNVSTALGVKIFRQLVSRADIVVESNPPQEMKRVGLDYETLHKLNPGLVMTSITPFGQTGPYRDYKGGDLIISNMSGEAYANPTEGVDDIERNPPLKGPVHVGDFATGLSGAVGTMSAVVARQATGLGQHVDSSQQEALAFVVRMALANTAYNNTVLTREKGLERAGGALSPSKDGWVLINATGAAFWDNVKDMMGNPDWTKRDIFQEPLSRTQNAEELNLLIAEWTKEYTTEEINEAAIAKRIPCSPVYTVKDMVNTEQLKVRDFFVEIDHPEAGRLKYPGAPYKLSATPWIVRRPAPLLGQHNEQVYCQMLGYTREDLVKMRQAGVI